MKKALLNSNRKICKTSLQVAFTFLAVWFINTTSKAQLPTSGTDITTVGAGTYTVNNNVIAITIECWGGGGAGGGANISTPTAFAAGGGGGGGGGAYSIVTNVGVTPGNPFVITVGGGGASANGAAGGAGGASYVFSNGSTVASAAGGAGGGAAIGTDACVHGTAGAGATTGVGFLHAGGNGAAGTGGNCNIAGGGGGGAGSTAAGGNASAATAGTGGSAGGGAGGGGATVSLNPVAGSPASTTNYGGAGGGGAAWPQPSGQGGTGKTNGGAGRQGKVVLTYTPCTPPSGGTISGSTTVCSSSSVTYTISGVTGSVDTYVWSASAPGTVTLGQNSTSATITWGAVTPGTNYTVTCTPAGSSGACKETAINYTVSAPALPGQPGVITPPTPICQNASGVYTVTAGSPAAASYTWSNSASWAGSSATNSISLTATSTPTNITCTPLNVCNVAGTARTGGPYSPNLPPPNTPGPITQF